MLAARNRYTGAYLPFAPDVLSLAERYGFSVPRVYQFDQLSDILARLRELDVTEEGYVVEFSDGQRFKFKGDRYLELQKLLIGLTFNNVLNAMVSGTLQTLITAIPDEYLAQVKQWIDEINQTVEQVKAHAVSIYEQAPKGSRKDFALWVQANHRDLSPYLFALFDGFDIVPLIYKMVNWGHRDKDEEGQEQN